MEWTVIVSIASGLGTLITTGVLIRNLMTSGEKGLSERLKKVEDQTDDHEKRIGSIEGEMRHLPTRESQHRIELSMGEMSKEIAVLKESLKPLRANGELLADLLREQVRNARDAA